MTTMKKLTASFIFRACFCFIAAQVACTGAALAAASAGFYVDPQSSAAVWVDQNRNDVRAESIKKNIANVPAAKWFGAWVGDIGPAVNAYVTAVNSQDKKPILVAYNIPNRDCGQYSAGGADSSTAYKTWISAFAAAIRDREAIVIFEPDALPHFDCLKPQEQITRLELIKYAVLQFKSKAPKAWVYLDIGNSGWLASSEAGKRLITAGINEVRGFSLNVSNFRTDEESRIYGNSINSYLEKNLGSHKPFVVDSSRNGKGSLGNVWCDPVGRKIGIPTRVNPAGLQPEMSLWIKSPGSADGCAASAGSFVPDIAFKMISGD